MTPSPLRISKLLGGLPTDRVDVRRKTDSRLREMESMIHGMEDRVDKVDGAVQALTNRFDRVEALLDRWDQKFDEMMEGFRNVSEFQGDIAALRESVDRNQDRLEGRLSRVENNVLQLEGSVGELGMTQAKVEALEEGVVSVMKRLEAVESLSLENNAQTMAKVRDEMAGMIHASENGARELERRLSATVGNVVDTTEAQARETRTVMERMAGELWEVREKVAELGQGAGIAANVSGDGSEECARRIGKAMRDVEGMI